MVELFTECRSGNPFKEIIGNLVKRPAGSERNGNQSEKSAELFLSESRMLSPSSTSVWLIWCNSVELS